MLSQTRLAARWPFARQDDSFIEYSDAIAREFDTITRMNDCVAPHGIEVTGVDRLLWLVHALDRVPLTEASRTLNVPEDVIERWAESLEEQGAASLSHFPKSALIKRTVMEREQPTLRERYLYSKRIARYG